MIVAGVVEEVTTILLDMDVKGLEIDGTKTFAGSWTSGAASG